MSENQKNTKNTVPPKGKSPQKPSGKGGQKKQFNFYWIYAIIGVILIGLQLFTFDAGVKKTTWEKFVNTMLKTGDVSRVVVVTTGTETKAEIYIKKEALQQEKYRDVKDKSSGRLGGRNPQYYLKVGTIDQFNDDLNRIQDDLAQENRIYPEYETRSNWTGEIIGWLLPIAILIGFWVFIMRRMTGGAGGHAYALGQPPPHPIHTHNVHQILPTRRLFATK